MLDTLFEGATVVDGTGAAPFTADVAVQGGRIVEVGRITAAARETINAHGAWLTPGFVDIHTHYDGQATWDETFSPSIHHGVTTLVMGNCGVGFAPSVPGREAELIALMEGVEDIPGVALAEGVKFNWQSFEQYLDVLDALPHSLDFLVQVPQDPLRMAVMGSRALAQQAATPADVVAMQSPQHFDAEFDLVESMARASGWPLSMTGLQREPGGFPGYKEVSHLPLAQRAQALREPAPMRAPCVTPASAPSGSRTGCSKVATSRRSGRGAWRAWRPQAAEDQGRVQGPPKALQAAT